MTDTIAPHREILKATQAQLYERFHQGRDVRLLVREWADAVDEHLREQWMAQGLGLEPDLALVAVGGYGRAELLPQSDIDVLVLHRQPQLADELRDRVGQFITRLWDLGLDIGSSVRSLDDCLALAGEDITVATNLMEARTLVGDDRLTQDMLELTGPAHVWPGAEFFMAKRDEQRARHAKHHFTEYNLEPDLKNAPGGLRDIQTIGWVAKRHFGAAHLRDLVHHGFLSPTEFDELDECQATLWRIRFLLNELTGRNETRILFDYQRRLAERVGYVDTQANRGVEQLMQDYYRAAMRISLLNEVLLQYFDEVILAPPGPDVITPINAYFQRRNDTVEITHPDVFAQHPDALLSLFVELGAQPKSVGIRASTIRSLMQHTHRIDEAFRADPAHRALFMQLLRAPATLFSQLRRMTRYGVLGRYLPAFGDIIGKMQYDLFHIYTVDTHTLHVIRNMREFRHVDRDADFPVVARVARQLPKIELLYLSGLFHDIAKGRGGDHSTLGAQDALTFCLDHGLSRWEAQLVAWLAEHHLLMSMTAQKKDVQDPDVIRDFAQVVGDVTHLDYLYALTVADICATNPNLWNSWRASLLRELYTQTRRALNRGLDNPPDKAELIRANRDTALDLLADQGIARGPAEAVFETLGEQYFIRENAQDIAWHVAAIVAHGPCDTPLVLLRDSHSVHRGGASQLFIYTPDRPQLFATMTAMLDQLDLNVLDARIITSRHGFSLDTYVVLERDGQRITDPARTRHIVAQLSAALSQKVLPRIGTQRRLPRQLKHFDIRTEVSLSNVVGQPYTVVEVITLDRPGLLARIGHLFLEQHINLSNARIATLGERAEDVFFVTDAAHQPLSDPEQCALLVNTLREQLDHREA